MFNPTPGPWYVTETKHGMLAIASKTTKYALPIAYMETALNYKVEDNARLMAAAPDMLAALRRAECALEDEGFADEDGSTLRMVRGAIANAEGKTPCQSM